MKIAAINNVKFFNHNVKNIPTSKKLNENITNSHILPGYNSSISFLGGDSLNLAKTTYNLDLANQSSNEDIYPNGIREHIQQILDEGNPENKKLKDVHQEHYQDLDQINTLEELQVFFDEFANVLDSKNIRCSKNSFIDKFNKGEFRDANGELLLNPDKDLAVQLIQAYYLDALSISDLTEILGMNPYSTMRKLNIPIFSQTYGKYLKLSDEEKNAAITNAQKRNRTINERSYLIKRKPLSKEHRQKISEGLIKYYKENPEAIFKRSESMQEYFSKHPIQEEIFSIVVKRAWSSDEGKLIRKKLSKFANKNKITASEATEMTQSPKYRSILEKFWKRNSYLKEKWSKAMQKSWDTQKTIMFDGLMHSPAVRARIVAISPNPAFNKLNAYLSACKSVGIELNPKYFDITCIGAPEFIITVPAKEDRDNIRKKDSNGEEYYDTTTRRMIQNYVDNNPDDFASIYMHLAKFLIIYSTLYYTLIGNNPSRQSKTSMLSMDYNKYAYTLEKIHNYTQSQLTKDNIKSVIQLHDIIVKAFEICEENGCNSLIEFFVMAFATDNNNSQDFKNISDHTIKCYKDYIKEHPELKF